MKPRLFDRILLAIILLVFIACMAAVAACVFGVIDAPMREAALDALDFSEHPYLAGGICAGAILLVVIAVKLLFTRSRKVEKDNGTNASLLMADENGAAYISAASIDSMAQRYIKSNNRIRECSSVVRIDDQQGVTVDLKAIVLADTNVPELCEKVRKELKQYIEEYAGVKVNQVSMMVVGTYSPAVAARVS